MLVRKKWMCGDRTNGETGCLIRRYCVAPHERIFRGFDEPITLRTLVLCTRFVCAQETGFPEVEGDARVRQPLAVLVRWV